ncbi:phage tail protein [Pseudomonas sp. TNT2022 ID357]|uniref:Phage tail protein n=1 Tax=Pseudomonas idahonensis TaxID=2942628 RepID=A0ABT5PYV9_9PSED|nr:phage tail protein [Pseudomonas idahonensis]MDD1147109.1 phage tail protein [Pseudomonas idahonensis]
MIDSNSQFFAILTAVGEAKQANATALGTPWTFKEMAVGDANGTDPIPNRAQTKLINEWRRAPVNQVRTDPANPNIIITEQVIPPDVGGRWIREIGLFDADGDLVAVANCAPSFKPLLAQGTGKTQIIRMNFIVANTAQIVLKVDPAVVLATREYVDTSIVNVLPANTVAGKFTQVEVNKRGIIQKGYNPTTLEAYGITNALPTGVQTDKRPILYAKVAGGDGDSVDSGALEIREAQLVGSGHTNFAYAPRILFHWSGVVSGALGMSAFGGPAWNGKNILLADGPEISGKADKTEVDTKVIQATSNKSDKATTLAGYGIGDAPTKAEMNAALEQRLSMGGGAMDGPLAISFDQTITRPALRLSNAASLTSQTMLKLETPATASYLIHTGSTNVLQLRNASGGYGDLDAGIVKSGGAVCLTESSFLKPASGTFILIGGPTQLPAGGTWAYMYTNHLNSGQATSGATGFAAGGQTVAQSYAIGWAWRIQ